MKSSAETPHRKKLCLKSGQDPFPHIRYPPTNTKAKSHSTNKVLCACGCSDVVMRRTQTHHLQGHGPLMAVAGVLKTRAYFQKHSLDDTESSQLRKRQKVAAPALEFWPPSQQDNKPPTSPPNPTPASATDPTSDAARIALSVPWTGPTDFRYDDDEAFEDLNEASLDEIEIEPAVSTPEPEGSDAGSDEDSDASESDPSEAGVSGMFDTNIDLNAAEYSKWAVASVSLTRTFTNPHAALADLGVGDFDLLHLFLLKINDDRVTDQLLMKIQYMLQCNLNTLHQMKKQLEELSELMAESYDCCIKSCVAFTGPHMKLKACPRCQKSCYCLNGQPMKIYHYIPLIPQLISFFLN